MYTPLYYVRLTSVFTSTLDQNYSIIRHLGLMKLNVHLDWTQDILGSLPFPLVCCLNLNLPTYDASVYDSR